MLRLSAGQKAVESGDGTGIFFDMRTVHNLDGAKTVGNEALPNLQFEMQMRATPNFLIFRARPFIPNYYAESTRFADERFDLGVCFVAGSNVNRQPSKMFRADVVPSAVG